MDYSNLYFNQIKAQVTQIKELFEDEKESLSFLRFCSSLIFNLKLEEIDELLTDGYDDLGADAIYLNVNDEDKEFQINLIQGKYNKTDCEKQVYNVEVGESIINKFKNIFDYLFGNSEENEFVNEEIKRKKEEYDNLIEKGYILNKVNFYVCHLGSEIAQRTNEVWLRWLEGNHFKDNINLINCGLLDLYKLYDESKTLTITENVTFYGKFFEFPTPDVKGFISTIEGKKLVDLFEKYGNKLFQKNIRYSLGENLINKKIIESAVSEDNRDKFWFLNNGITIVCKKYTKASPQTENMCLNLEDFQIVNGAQTTSALKEALEKTGNIDQVKIIVKVFQAEDELAELITDSTNSQNPVSKRDLRSNDEIQKLIGDEVKLKNYYYQRKRNQFIQENDKSKIIDNYDFAQRYYSFYKDKPAEARNKKAQIFNNDEIYNSIFNRNLNGETVIFIHNAFSNLLKGLRQIKLKFKKEEIEIDKELVDISQRAKFHLFHSFKILFTLQEKDINSSEFKINEDTLKEFVDLDKIKDFLEIINSSVNELMDESQNKVKVFQKKELAEKIEDKIIEKFSENE
ncbi:AIPR family protein [archaeon]|jgi:hypothetical protein|nr:AIPR family protein [archaeon]MBT7381301.1 AIPR family protein [archaeon]MBT7507768.1 AIPR family protein [archaeon]